MNKDRVRKEDTRPDEQEEAVLDYLSQLGFTVDANVSISVGNRRFEADAIAYSDPNMKVPNVVVEIKDHLPRDVTILDVPVQQAFAIAAAFGNDVRFLLITDGVVHHWFERNAQTQSLERITNPPTPQDVNPPVVEGQPTLLQI